MEIVRLPNMPERAQDFRLDNGSFARVTYSVQENKPDRIVIEAQAFEVDDAGNFVAIKTGPLAGAPSRTPGTTHMVARSGIVAKTHTWKPGWVVFPGNYDPAAPQGAANAIPENTPIFSDPSQLPTDAQGGNLAWVGDNITGSMWRYDADGLLFAILRGKAEELHAILVTSADFDNMVL